MLVYSKQIRLVVFHGKLTMKKKVNRTATYLRTCAPSEDSDQTARMRSLIRIFTGCILESQINDQTAQMRWWILILVGGGDGGMSEGTFFHVTAQVILSGGGGNCYG